MREEGTIGGSFFFQSHCALLLCFYSDESSGLCWMEVTEILKIANSEFSIFIAVGLDISTNLQSDSLSI